MCRKRIITALKRITRNPNHRLITVLKLQARHSSTIQPQLYPPLTSDTVVRCHHNFFSLVREYRRCRRTADGRRRPEPTALSDEFRPWVPLGRVYKRERYRRRRARGVAARPPAAGARC
ncbi:hypothetical protein EVAR_31174_1 [Eumeta japonica]|uniref:Uncharacterized protein n=1 Tax=Eumeta variegata TaxID=151549 RepID=A0A4C1VXF4_EUMVA|nr:hypothetical protein EVAR_31174_1 [Eumeta japonica]